MFHVLILPVRLLICGRKKVYLDFYCSHQFKTKIRHTKSLGSLFYLKVLILYLAGDCIPNHYMMMRP
jgi:hypothetical protein